MENPRKYPTRDAFTEAFLEIKVNDYYTAKFAEISSEPVQCIDFEKYRGRFLKIPTRIHPINRDLEYILWMFYEKTGIDALEKSYLMRVKYSGSVEEGHLNFCYVELSVPRNMLSGFAYAVNACKTGDGLNLDFYVTANDFSTERDTLHEGNASVEFPKEGSAKKIPLPSWLKDNLGTEGNTGPVGQPGGPKKMTAGALCQEIHDIINMHPHTGYVTPVPKNYMTVNNVFSQRFSVEDMINPDEAYDRLTEYQHMLAIGKKIDYECKFNSNRYEYKIQPSKIYKIEENLAFLRGKKVKEGIDREYETKIINFVLDDFIKKTDEMVKKKKAADEIKKRKEGARDESTKSEGE